MSKTILFQAVQLNGSKYCYVSLTIQLKHHLFSQLNAKTAQFQTIQFSVSTQF